MLTENFQVVQTLPHCKCSSYAFKFLLTGTKTKFIISHSKDTLSKFVSIYAQSDAQNHQKLHQHILTSLGFCTHKINLDV